MAASRLRVLGAAGLSVGLVALPAPAMGQASVGAPAQADSPGGHLNGGGIVVGWYAEDRPGVAVDLSRVGAGGIGVRLGAMLIGSAVLADGGVIASARGGVARPFANAGISLGVGPDASAVGVLLGLGLVVGKERGFSLRLAARLAAFPDERVSGVEAGLQLAR